MAAPYETAIAPAPKLRYRDYRETGAEVGVGRGVFRRLRKAGAFNEGNANYASNPFLESGQEAWKANPGAWFTGPARMRYNPGNVGRAGQQAIDNTKAAHDAAVARSTALLEGAMPTLNAAGAAAKSALENPVLSPQMIQASMARARERIAREGGQSRAGIAAQIAGSGGRDFSGLDAAYAGQEGRTLYDLSMAEGEQEQGAAITNRQGLLDAIQGAGGYQGSISTMIGNLLANEEFRNSLTQEELNNMYLAAGLKQAAA